MYISKFQTTEIADVPLQSVIIPLLNITERDRCSFFLNDICRIFQDIVPTGPKCQ